MKYKELAKTGEKLSVVGLGCMGMSAAYGTPDDTESVSTLDLYFWKEAYKSIGYSSMVYPKIELNMIAFTALMVVLTGILSTLYPAYKALKVNPANATRTK